MGSVRGFDLKQRLRSVRGSGVQFESRLGIVLARYEIHFWFGFGSIRDPTQGWPKLH